MALTNWTNHSLSHGLALFKTASLFPKVLSVLFLIDFSLVDESLDHAIEQNLSIFSDISLDGTIYVHGAYLGPHQVVPLLIIALNCW